MTSSDIKKIVLGCACMMILAVSVCQADTADTGTKEPSLLFSPAAFTFDPVVEGTVVTHSFTAVNQGDQTIHVLQVKTG